MKIDPRESHQDLLARLERTARDDFDEHLYQCLKATTPEEFQTLANRAGVIAAAIRHRSVEGRAEREILERYDRDCEELLLQYCILAEGITELDLFQTVVFKRRVPV